MTDRQDMRSVAAFRRVALAAGAAVAGLGAVVLAGWAFDVSVVKSVVPGFVTMKANSAAAFVLAGASLLLAAMRREQPSAVVDTIPAALGAAVAAVGGLTLAEYWLRLDFAIDELLFADRPAASGTSPPGRMSPFTAAGFVLAGTALAAIEYETPSGRRPAQYLAVALILVVFPSLIGYLYGLPELISIPGYTQIAVHTAGAFVVLAIGILAAVPDGGVMALVAGPGPGSVALRRLLPAVVALMLLLGWLLGERGWAGFRATEGLALPILMIASVTIGAIVWWAAVAVNASAAARDREARTFEDLLEFAPDAIVAIDAAGRIVLINTQTETLFGYRRDALLGRPIEMLIPERFHARHEAHRTGYKLHPMPRPMGAGLDLYGRRSDGTEFAAEISLGPLDTPKGKLVTAAIRDVTRRKAEEAAIKTMNVELERRVAERVADLKAVNDELEAFAYSISHDLRAPLRHISGFVDLLVPATADGRLDDQARHRLAIIADSANRMGGMIDDLLSFSRMNQAEILRQQVNLSTLAAGVIADAKREAPGRDIAWIVAPLPTVPGDPAMLKMVLVNLVSNAVKFTRASAPARIEIGSSVGAGGEIVVFVRDNGVGFDMQYAEKLFGVFRRLHREDEFEGTGIGLANVRRIVGRHGGRTWAEAALGRGATFFFSLPAA
jgi:PAS domain S-box-containing protein